MNVPLRYLDVGEMLAITEAWLGPGRRTFESVPEIRPLLPRVEAAHLALAGARPVQSRDESAAVIAAMERKIDVRHDHALRALYHALESYAAHLLSQDPPQVELAERARATRERLLPDGLAGTQASYADEAARSRNAAALAATDDGIRNVLGRVRIADGTTGNDLLATWAALGARLGELERQKNAATQHADSVTASDYQALVQARSAWSRVVITVLTLLDHADGPAEAVAAIRQSVVEPATRAAERSAAASHTPAAAALDEASDA